MKILIAEDDPLVMEMLVDLFEGAGFNVVECENGKLALEEFKSGQFDFVCTDYNMPEMNGLELIKAIRKINSSVPIAMYSAQEELGAISLRNLTKKVGGDKYFRKSEMKELLKFARHSASK